MTDTPGLNDAYGLTSAEDNIDLYANWAKTYDQSFADAHGYILPSQVGRACVVAGVSGRVLDVGAGTGLVGEFLVSHGVSLIDGCDISPEMLSVAATKGCYTALFECDLTQDLNVADAQYDAIVSAGTFTLGHVGPDAFDELLRIAKPGALFVISINKQHFGPAGFEAKFQDLSSVITDLHLPEV
ncbi:MAG: class I SAM-dependent DNA methyltransferase, partial [Planktomarina sp.]